MKKSLKEKTRKTETRVMDLQELNNRLEEKVKQMGWNRTIHSAPFVDVAVPLVTQFMEAQGAVLLKQLDVVLDKYGFGSQGSRINMLLRELGRKGLKVAYLVDCLKELYGPATIRTTSSDPEGVRVALDSKVMYASEGCLRDYLKARTRLEIITYVHCNFSLKKPT